MNNLIKKFNCLILFLLLPIARLKSDDKISLKQEDEKHLLIESFNDFLVNKAIPIGIALSYFYFFSDEKTQIKLQKQLTPNNLFKNFLQQYSLHLMAMIIHELGHALAAKILNNNPIQINIGSNKKRVPFFHLGPLSINGINPNEGYSKFKTPYQNLKTILKITKEKNVDLDKEKLTELLKLDKKKYAEIYLSGGIFSFLIFGFLKTFLTINNQSDDQNRINATLNSILLEQAFNALIPLSENSDAAKIWKNCLNLSDNIIETVSVLEPFIYRLVQFCLLHPNSSVQTNILDKIALLEINLSLKGFLRFDI